MSGYMHHYVQCWLRRGAARQSVEYVRERSQDYKHTRRASDI